MKKLILLFFVSITNITFAQERQIAFDPDGKIDVITASIEKKLLRFTVYEGFKEARLFQQNDTVFILEILYRPESTLIRAKEVLDLAQVNQLREEIYTTLKAKAPTVFIDQTGRSSLIAISSAVGLGYYGPAVLTLLDPDNEGFGFGMYMLSAAGGFAVPYFLTRNKEVTEAEFIMAGYGQTRGILHGMLLPLMFDEEPHFKTHFALGLVGSIAESIGGYQWAKKKQFNVGQAFTIGTYGDFGMGIGMGLAHSFGLYDSSSTNFAVAASAYIGAAGGLILGNHLSKKDYYTFGDAWMLSSAGVLGAYLPFSLLSILPDLDPRAFTFAASLGAAGGLLVGDRIAQKYDFSNRQGIYIGLSEMAGGLVGAGVGFLLSGMTFQNHDFLESENMAQVVAICSGLGALAGFGLSVSNFSKIENLEDSNLSFNFSINPVGLLNFTKSATDYSGRNNVPLLMGSVRF